MILHSERPLLLALVIAGACVVEPVDGPAREPVSEPVAGADTTAASGPSEAPATTAARDRTTSPELRPIDSGTSADLEALWLAPDATLWAAVRGSSGGTQVRSLSVDDPEAGWRDRSTGLDSRVRFVELSGTKDGSLFGCGLGAVWTFAGGAWSPLLDWGDTAPFRIAGAPDGTLVALCPYYPRLLRLREADLWSSAGAPAMKPPFEEGPGLLQGEHVRFTGGDWADPSRWVRVPVEGDTTSPTDRLHDVWSPAEGELVAVGSRGQLLRLAEGGFRVESVGVDVELLSVWGDRSDRIVAVGRGGVVVRFDGDGWSVLAAPTDQDLLSVRGRAGGRVFAGGAGGVLFELSG